MGAAMHMLHMVATGATVGTVRRQAMPTLAGNQNTQEAGVRRWRGQRGCRAGWKELLLASLLLTHIR